jgi:SAM-dependent methyltransferase
LGYHWLTALYDPLVRVTMPETAFKERLLEQARIEPEHTILDIGCGTGTLLLLLGRKRRPATMVGLDADGKVLRIAAAKARRHVAEIGLVQALSLEIPFADKVFDRVLSSLTLHHLTRPEKLRTLAEIFRILRSGGELHVADWGRPHNLLMRLLSVSVRLGDGRHRTADNLDGRLPDLFSQAGFEAVSAVDRFATAFGTLALYRARKPGIARMPGADRKTSSIGEASRSR